ncbi:MAG: LrgB family protein [Gammaproteobacteria bacterium]|nr:LrgB family protein [Gammaproteobacteria bacterium]
MIDLLTQHIANYYSANILIVAGFLLTLMGYLAAKFINIRFPRFPLVIAAIIIVVSLLAIFDWHYTAYAQTVAPLFNHILGYATVALAIPLATIKFDQLPIKRLFGLFAFATVFGSVLPMSLAYGLHLAQPEILAFATRAVTTPIALNVAALTHAPLTLVSFIVIFSGLIGAVLSPLILRNIDDERAAGFAMGLAAHAIGTAQAWQRSPIAGEYAAFGMAVNAVITAMWVIPVFS